MVPTELRMMSLRVLFLAPSLGKQLVFLAKALAARGHDVHVALIYAGTSLEEDLISAGIPVHHLCTRGRWNLLGSLRRLISTVRRERPDVLYGYLPPANILAAVACRFIRGPKLVFGVPGSDSEPACDDFMSRTTLKIEAALARYAQLIISNSAAGLRRARGMPPGRNMLVDAHSSAPVLAEQTEMALAALSQPLVMHVIAGLGTGGAEGTLARLVQVPGPFRHLIVSLTGDGAWGERLRYAGIEVVNLGMRRGAPSPLGLWRLARLMRRLRPTVVQTWMYHGDLLGILAAPLAGDFPVVWNLRCSNMDLSFYRRTTRWVMHILASLSSRPDAIVANSWAGQRWHEQIGYRARKWVLIPNGIDVETFRPNPQARRKWLERLGIAPDTVLVGMAARRDPMKDHETLLSAMSQVSVDVACAMVGEKIDSSDSALAQLASQASKPIHLLGYCQDMPGFMAALDIAVLASKFGEGFPNVVAEAMACGVPCVVTDVGDAAVIVASTGKIVPARDATAMADAISALATDHAERVRLGALARERIVLHYALPRVASRYHELWSSLAKSRKTGL